MKAALAENGKMVWKDVPDPIVRKNDVLVKIYATALNRADLLQKNGAYPSPEGWPAWPGLELAGTVEEMGQTAREKSGLHIGDKVCALVGGGGYAEKAGILSALVKNVWPLVKNVWPLVENGAIRPSIYKVLPACQVNEAQGILERFENTGKVVLKIR